MPPYANPEHLDHHSPDLGGATFDQNPAQKEQVRYKLVGERDDDSWDPPVITGATVETADPKAAASVPKPKAVQRKQLPLMFQRLLDFNPCTDIKIAHNSLSSALFKIRVCSECGAPVVHKLKGGGGYEKEHLLDTVTDKATGEESTVERKVYFHSSCLQTKMHRTNHYETGFGAVLVELQEVVRSKAEERKRREKEELERAAAAARLLALQQQEEEEETKAKGRKKGLAKRAKRYLKFFSRNSSRGGKQRKKSTKEAAVRGVEV